MKKIIIWFIIILFIIVFFGFHIITVKIPKGCIIAPCPQESKFTPFQYIMKKVL